MKRKFQSKFNSENESPGFLLWKASNIHQRLQRQALQELNITPTQFSILACFFFLSQKNTPVSQSLVCEYAGLDKMHVSDTTKALLKKRLIEKRVSPHDRRAFSISVTADGVKTCKKALQIIEDLDLNFFSKAGSIDEYLKVLRSLLE